MGEGRKTRTAEEIRAAVAAELPGLRAARGRLLALAREMKRTPEHRRWRQLLDRGGEESSVRELDIYADLVGTIEEEVRELSGVLIRPLERETDPKRWARASARLAALGEP